MEVPSDFFRISVCTSASPPNPTPSLTAAHAFAFHLSLTMIPLSLPPYLCLNIAPPSSDMALSLAATSLAVGWSIFTQAAAILSLRMVHMACGHGGGPVRTLSGWSTDQLLLVSVKGENIVQGT